MKFIALLFALLLSLPASGLDQQEWCKRIDTSSTNITTAFSGYGAISFGGNTIKRITGVDFVNFSAKEVAVNCSASSTTAPSDTSAYNLYANPNFGFGTNVNAVQGKYCFIRSMAGSDITTGIVIVCVTGF